MSEGGGLKILDIGCGDDKVPGAVGIDCLDYPDVDVTHDLNAYPWPFEDNTFDVIISNGSIEMLDNILPTMNEIHRISKPGACFKITTPHFAASNAHWDPLQKWRFSYYTFDYFCEGFENPVYTDRKYRIIKRELQFSRKWGLGRLVYNLSPRRYEKYYAYRYPARRMYIELEVIK